MERFVAANPFISSDRAGPKILVFVYFVVHPFVHIQRPLFGKKDTMRCNIKGYPQPEIWMTINGLNVTNISSVKFKVIRCSVGIQSYQFVLTDDYLIGNGNYTCFARNKYGTSNNTWIINEPEGENIYF